MAKFDDLLDNSKDVLNNNDGYNKLNEPKGRIRVSKACDRCRTQKIKCSGTYPCTTCTKHKRECIYSSNQQVARTKEVEQVPTILNTKTPKELPYVIRSEDKSYIRHLENRIQYLESRLSAEGEKVASFASNGETEDETTERFVSLTSKWRYSNRNQILLISELCYNTYSYLNDENKTLVDLPRSQYFGWNMSGTHYLSPEALPSLPEVNLDHDISFYVDYFFKEINPLFAIVHEPVFRLQVESYLALTNNNEIDDTNETKLFEAMLYLIVVIVIRFTEFQKKKDLKMENLDIEEILFKHCHRIVKILSFEWESFELIQCWLLMTLYLRVTHRQTSFFQSMGYAISMTKSMGLSRRSVSHRIPGTAYEGLKAKRIFWSVFVFERLFGLQSGRYGLLSVDEIELDFPSYDFKVENQKDNWITLPSLALIQIAKLSSVVHSASREKLDLLKYQQINKEIVFLNNWLNDNGFNNNEIFNNPNETISSLVKSQVKLHYYDLILSIHGKILFNFVGRRIATQGLKIEMVLDSCINIVEIYLKISKAGLLYTPWYFGLLLLFNVGVNFLILINAGLFLPTARDYYSRTINLITILKKANVKSEDNKIIVKNRFKMVEECLWALKNASKMLTLRFKQDLDVLNSIGIDPGSNEVNKQTFTQYGLANDVARGEVQEFTELIRTGKRRRLDSHDSVQGKTINKHSRDDSLSYQYEDGPATSNTDNSGGGSIEIERMEKERNDKKIYGNLTWFDQWLDFNLDSELLMNNISSDRELMNGSLSNSNEEADDQYNFQ